jgi:predicted RNase H-like HicB family nuclease
MRATDYGVMVVWSEEDKSYLARVLELPGCVADGETREEAVENAAVVIQDWIDTAKELGRKVPRPLSDDDYDKQAKELMNRNQAQFEKAVNDAVQKALHDIVPKLMEQFQQSVFAAAEPTNLWVGRISASPAMLLNPCVSGRRR